MIYLYHGSDATVSRNVLQQLISKYNSSEVEYFKHSDLDVTSLKVVAETKPMFSEKRLLVVEGIPQKGVLDDLGEYLPQIPEYTDVAIWSDKQLKGSQKIVKLLRAMNGEVHESKLLASGDIFPFLDALVMHKKKEVYFELGKLLERGEDPVYILTMIVWQLRNMLFDGLECSQLQKLHPYVQKQAHRHASMYSVGELKKIYTCLLSCDVKIKTGALPRRIALENLLLEFT